MQWDKPLAQSIHNLYKAGTITQQTVYNAVGADLISAQDYEKITGEPYSA
jgi:hypothetical protein